MIGQTGETKLRKKEVIRGIHQRDFRLEGKLEEGQGPTKNA